MVAHIKKIVKDKFEVQTMTHTVSKFDEVNLPCVREFEPDHAHCVTFAQGQVLSVAQRLEVAHRLVAHYNNAHCVITSRLHVALPCLSQKTPVLLTLPENGVGIADMNLRYPDYLTMLHHNSYEDFLTGSVDYDFIHPPENPDKYLQLRNNLLAKCNEFIQNCESGNIADRCPFTAEQRKDLMIEILQNKVWQLKNVVDTKNSILATTASKV